MVPHLDQLPASGSMTGGALAFLGSSDCGQSEIREQYDHEPMNDLTRLNGCNQAYYSPITFVESQRKPSDTNSNPSYVARAAVGGPSGANNAAQFGATVVTGYSVSSMTKDDQLIAMQMQHQLERDQDRAKIASLEQYIESVHCEFAKNKRLMQMLVDKVEADQKLIEQANDLRLALQHSVKPTKVQVDRGCQTDNATSSAALTIFDAYYNMNTNLRNVTSHRTSSSLDRLSSHVQSRVVFTTTKALLLDDCSSSSQTDSDTLLD